MESFYMDAGTVILGVALGLLVLAVFRHEMLRRDREHQLFLRSRDELIELTRAHSVLHETLAALRRRSARLTVENRALAAEVTELRDVATTQSAALHEAHQTLQNAQRYVDFIHAAMAVHQATQAAQVEMIRPR